MKTVESEIGAVLDGTVPEIIQRSIFRRLGDPVKRPPELLGIKDRRDILNGLEQSLRLFAAADSGDLLAACRRVLHLAGEDRGSSTFTGAGAPSAVGAVKKLDIGSERDIAAARSEAWTEAVRMGLSKFASVKVATAVSELTRNIVFYAGRGSVELRSARDERGLALHVVVADEGPGIDDATLKSILAGTYRSQKGLGRGLLAVKRLSESFDLDTTPGKGTTVTCVFRGAE